MVRVTCSRGQVARVRRDVTETMLKPLKKPPAAPVAGCNRGDFRRFHTGAAGKAEIGRLHPLMLPFFFPKHSIVLSMCP
eukprot:3992582-Prymnesium_polylepis.1